MNIKTSIEVLAEPIGFDIAMSDDRTQAQLLNGLGRGFDTMRSPNDYNMQVCYVSQHLTPSAKALITKLSEFINEG